MNMKIRLKHLFMLLFLSVAGMATAQEEQMQMPKIPVDTAVRIGKLPNGLTYYIRHNNWPENVANFYIAQRVGSLQENDDQRGLAHFLEHMAFNGSEHFKDNGVIEYTRSLGVEFGSNLNAYTGIDQTVYRVCDVPTKRQSALDSCLLILKDWSNGLTLDPKEIDKERGVIHQEWQLRSSASERMFERALPKLYPGSKYGHRMPIGLMSIIDNFKPKFLADYYHKWYRPDNQAIIVVGDVDVNHIEAEIKKLWANSTVPAGAAQVTDEPVPDNPQAIYVYEKDKEQPYTIVSIAMKHDPVSSKQKETVDYFLDQYGKELITNMLNARLAELAQKPDCPFNMAQASDGQYIFSKTKDAFQLDAMAKEGKMLPTITAGMTEIERVYQHGFTATEFERAKSDFLSALEKAYNERDKVKNAQYGDQYRDNYLDNEPIPSISDYYHIMKQLTAMVNVDMINQFVKELITPSDTNLVVLVMDQEKAGKTYPTEAQMAEAVKAARTAKIDPYVDNVKNEPLVPQLPAKGSIVGETENAKLGYKELTLSNGAKVVLKKTNFKNDEIVFKAYAKGGKSLYGKADYKNLAIFDDVIEMSGLGNFSHTELPKATAGKNVSLGMNIGNFYTILTGATVPKDLETLLQINYLYFTNIKKDQQSYNSLMNLAGEQLKNKGLKPEGAFSDSLTVTIHNHNPRFIPLEAKDLNSISYDRILAIAKERLANAGNYTFMFVGNFDESTLRPFIEQYIASLPGNSKEKVKEADIDPYAKKNITNSFARKMETPKSQVVETWLEKVPYTLENSILTDAAAQVLSMDYLKNIREDNSAAYSVGTRGYMSIVGKNAYAILQTYCPMDPQKADLVLKLIAEGMNNNTQKVNADNLQKVKDFMLKQADEDFKKNSTWIDVINDYKEYGVDLYTDYKNTVSKLTTDQMAKFLSQLTKKGVRLQVIMNPAK